MLESLRIVEAVDGAKKLRIPTAFSTNLGKALAGNTEEPWRLQGVTVDKKPPTLDQLDQWTRWRWTNVLLFLTGEALDETAIPPQCAQDFLKGAQLMTPIEGGMLEITGQGVDFLLKPRAEQVWVLVDEYLAHHAPQNDRGDVVALILSLAYTTVGRSYAIAELSDPQQRAGSVVRARTHFPAEGTSQDSILLPLVKVSPSARTKRRTPEACPYWSRRTFKWSRTLMPPKRPRRWCSIP